MPNADAAYRAIISELDAEIPDLERRLSEARALRDGLYRRMGLTPPDEGPQITRMTLLPVATPQPNPSNGRGGEADSGRVRDTTARIYAVIRENPGKTSGQIADMVATQLNSQASDLRKLVSSSVSYMVHGKRTVRKDELGRLYALDPAEKTGEEESANDNGLAPEGS